MKNEVFSGHVGENEKIIKFKDLPPNMAENEIVKFGDMYNLLKRKIIIIASLSALVTLLFVGVLNLFPNKITSYVGFIHIVPNINEKGLSIDEINLRYLLYNDSLKNIAELVKKESIAIEALSKANISVDFMSMWKENVSVKFLSNTGFLEIKVSHKDDSMSKKLATSLVELIKEKIEVVYPDLSVNVNSNASKVYGSNNSIFNSIPGYFIIFLFGMFMIYIYIFIETFFGSKISNENQLLRITEIPLIIKSKKGDEKKSAFLINTILLSKYDIGKTKVFTWIGFTNDINSVRILNESICLLKDRNMKSLIIDVDFKNKSLSTFYGVEKKQGLSDAIKNEINKELLKNYIITNKNGVDILPFGKDVIDEIEFINSIYNIQNAISNIVDDYDIVYISTASTKDSSESITFAKCSNLTILTIKQNKLNANAVEDNIRILSQLDVNVLGFIMTDTYM